MKNLIYLFVLSVFIISCSDNFDNDSLSTNNTEATKRSNDNIININEVASNEDDFELPHNEKMKAIISKLEMVYKKKGTISNDKFRAIFKNVFQEELALLTDHVYYDLYSDPIRYKAISKALVKKIMTGEDQEGLENDPLGLEFYNEALASMPVNLDAEIVEIAGQMANGIINPDNYIEELDSRQIAYLENNELDQNQVLTTMAAFKTFKESYILWHPKDQGGEGYFFKYLVLRDNTEIYLEENDSRMNDNDWPNEATTPKWADNDVIGAAAGFLTSWNPWGALVGGVASSLMT